MISHDMKRLFFPLTYGTNVGLLTIGVFRIIKAGRSFSLDLGCIYDSEELAGGFHLRVLFLFEKSH